eukprot:g10245.t1
MDGNLMLSGRRCMQRMGRLHSAGRYAGYVFDVNKTVFGKTQRRGEGWKGEVQHYICIVPGTTSGTNSGVAAARGVFILPHEYVFRSEKGDAPSHRGRLVVYPHFVVPRNARSQAKQAEQEKYFVDFETMSKSQQVAKASQLLQLEQKVVK